LDLGLIHLSAEVGLWIGFIVCGVLLVVFRDWRITLPTLLGDYVLLCVLLSRLPFIPQDLLIGRWATSYLVLVKAINGLTVVGILVVTVVLRRRVHLPESERPLDEITAARLRWAARRVAQAKPGVRSRLTAYLLPVSSLAILIAGTYTLASLYPLARTPTLPESEFWFYVDLIWYWLGLCGLFNVLFAQEVQEVCVGLLLCISSVDILYTILSRSVGLLSIGLLNTVSILLALGSAYLSLLFYLRLQRWQLPSAGEWDS